jgi:hypothetical protein
MFMPLALKLNVAAENTDTSEETGGTEGTEGTEG